MIKEEELKRFWSRVRKTDNCWYWLGSTSMGYGQIRAYGSYWKSHRFSYLIHKGEIPKGLCVMHICDNKLCVNPEHLKVGTHKENSQDMVDKGRSAHNSGEKHGMSRLTQVQVDKIRELYKTNKYLQKELGKMFGVNQRHISRIINNKRWIKN